MGPDVKECRKLLGDCDLSDAEIEQIRNTLIAIATNILNELTREVDTNDRQ
ncbi:MAG: hypothetical protein ACE1Z4_01525 [Gammaproteobacteria bacterium]|nr:hypothetical protein [Gammaproteobacteria bacterium]